jgi:hypothetical protein
MKSATVILSLLMSFPMLAVEPVQPSVYYVHGVCYQELAANNITVGIAVYDNGSNRQMDVSVTNRSNVAVDVIPGPDYFTLTEREPKLQSLKYKTEHDLTSSVNHKIMWASIIAGVGSALATDTSTVRTQTPYGTYTTTITTPSYAQQAQFNDLANQAQSLGQAKISQIHQQYLQRTTLLPGTSVDGSVFFSRERKATQVEARVNIAGNSFSFVFPPSGNSPAPLAAPLRTTPTLPSGSTGITQASSSAITRAIQNAPPYSTGSKVQDYFNAVAATGAPGVNSMFDARISEGDF